MIYSNATFTPYLVRVSIEDLNIRKGPGTNYDKTGKYPGKGAFTIVEEAVIRTKAKLLILDPIQAYLGGGMDMNRANEARDMTKKLATLAEMFFVKHFSLKKASEFPVFNEGFSLL